MAINYIKENTTHYRTQCYHCIRKKRGLRLPKPKWAESGYKKKSKCDICGFRSTYSAQTLVYHIDGNLKNTNVSNLRTVCLNCTVVIQKSDSVWKDGDLEADH